MEDAGEVSRVASKNLGGAIPVAAIRFVKQGGEAGSDERLGETLVQACYYAEGWWDVSAGVKVTVDDFGPCN